MGRLGGTPRPTARNAAADATGRVPPDAAAVAQKRNPAFVPLNVGKDGIGRYNYEWDDAEGRRIEMVNSCIVNKAREMFILTFLHTKGDALTVAPVK